MTASSVLGKMLQYLQFVVILHGTLNNDPALRELLLTDYYLII